MKRKIVHIDAEKCNGCGLCIEACHEGAIQLVNGKARLVSDVYCDGLGACLGECPQGAITIEEREAAAFSVEAVAARKTATEKDRTPSGCPGMRAARIPRRAESAGAGLGAAPAAQASALEQWPIQLHLVPVEAPYWDGAELLIAADCVAFAYGPFHCDLLRGRRLIIACPKLDDTSGYVDKLAAILATNDIRGITIAHMQVPCCQGLVRLVQAAIARVPGKRIPVHEVTIGIDGERQ
jgi:NAD-dependent dihydropyrimidine dehydrogenase PreA subunit